MKTTEDIQIVKQNLKQQLFETRLNNILFKEKMIINASGIIMARTENKMTHSANVFWIN